MPSRYDASTKAKTVRLVRQHRADYPTEYAAITAVAGRLGMTAETLRLWIRQLRTAKIYETRPGGAITISAVGADDRPVESSVVAAHWVAVVAPRGLSATATPHR
jgi:transposase-like protein